MEKCPDNPTMTTCGLEAVRILADEKLIVIEPYEEHQPVKIDIHARPVMEVLKARQVRRTRGVDSAIFECLACGKLVQIEDDDGDLSASFFESPD